MSVAEAVAAVDDRQRFRLGDHPMWKHVKFDAPADVYISDMARVRGRLASIEVGRYASLADFVVLTADAPLRIGHNVKIGPSAILCSHAPLRICANAKIGAHAQVLTGGYDDEGAFWRGPVEVGTGAIIGPGAVILPGVTIKAGAYVPPNAVVGRNAA